MTMIDPSPASAFPHHQYHQSFSKQQFSCNKRVYVVREDNNSINNKEDRPISVMSRVEEDEEGGYGCTTSNKLDFEAETESTNHIIDRRSDLESEEEEEEEEKDHRPQQHNLLSDQEDESITKEGAMNEAATTASAFSSLLFKDAAVHDHQEDENWLQLSTGGSRRETSHNGRNDHCLGDNHQSSSTSVVELELLPGCSSIRPNTTTTTSASSMFLMPEFGAHLALTPPPFANIVTTEGGGNGNGNGASSSSNYYNYYSSSTNNTSLFMPQYHHHHHNHGDQIEFNWGGSFRPFHHQTNIQASPSGLVPTAATVASASASSYFAPRPFLLHAGLGLTGPLPRQSAIDFRVIDPPPRRPFSGIWFMLLAAQNQAKEPFLPQIPKSFLRIKDGKMTIRLVMKYLAKKLRLEDESEVEIKCREQQMEPMLTLQQVRDCIWTSPSHFVTLLPHSSPTDHIMVLSYGRCP